MFRYNQDTKEPGNFLFYLSHLYINFGKTESYLFSYLLNGDILLLF